MKKEKNKNLFHFKDKKRKKHAEERTVEKKEKEDFEMFKGNSGSLEFYYMLPEEWNEKEWERMTDHPAYVRPSELQWLRKERKVTDANKYTKFHTEVSRIDDIDDQHQFNHPMEHKGREEMNDKEH